MYEYKVTPNEFIGKWYYLFPLEDNSIYINLFSSNIFEDSDFKNIYKKGENLMIDLHKAEYNDKIVTYENIKESIEDGYFDKILKENISNAKFCFNVV